MPTTRTGRQSSPSKGEDSPSKMRVQPMRGARLRSASPFLDNTSASASASASQQSSQASSPTKASPSKVARSSPRKKAPAASNSLQPPARRSTRSRSRSVDPDSLPVIDEDASVAAARDLPQVVKLQDEEAETSTDEQESPISAPRLASASKDAAASILPGTIDVAEASSSSFSSDSDAGSDSDSGSDSSTDSDDASSASSSEDEEEGDSTTDLDALLKASQQAYKNRTPAPAAQSRFEDNQDIISFGGALDNASSSKRPGKAMPLVVKAKHQVAKSPPNAAGKQSSSSKSKIDQQIEALNQAAPASDKKKSKHARTIQTTTGSSWFDMPEFGASAARLAALKKQSAADSGHSKATGGDARLASADQLRREVQALRLRNALDPKRFYRASAKNQAMPKFAQLGKIIASPLEPKAVLSRQERGRTVVEELIRDAEAASYAKRKFGESQASHRSNYNGRRKPPSKKRRT